MTQQNSDKQSFVMYNSFLEAANNLPDADFKKCILSIRDYALFGIDEETDNWAINIILSMAKPLLASARKRYENCVENGYKGKDYGKNGGRPKKNVLEEKPQMKPQSNPLNVNADEKLNDYVDENSNVYETNNKLLIKSSNLHDEFLRFMFKPRPNEMDELEYYEFWLADTLYKLVKMDDGELTKDSNLFFEAVKYYMLMYGVKDKNQAIKDINQLKRIAKTKIDAYLNDN